MATSAFKSATKRTPIGKVCNTAEDSASTNRNSGYRRSRSLSRFSRRLPAAEEYFDDVSVPRGRFVNTMRGSGFPEISLDDLAIELFNSGGRGGGGGLSRLTSRNDIVSPNNFGSAASQQRRGRSVSRQRSRVGSDGKDSVGGNSGGGRVVQESISRRRRSMSVVRCQISDSESDLDQSHNFGGRVHPKTFNRGNNQTPLSQRSAVSNNRQVLRRSLSQRALKPHDGYSSHSSALTDDEGRDYSSSKNVNERTIRAVYAQKAEHPTGDNANGGLYEAMRKELRHAVEEIRMELEQAMIKTKNPVLGRDCLQSNKSDVFQAVSAIRKNYATKLEKSEKRRQDLLTEIVLEEQHGRELSQFVEELVPAQKNTVPAQKPSRARKRSNDRSRMSTRLTEEAEKYIEDFISNVEDTDFSSLDGERSDTTSSTLGGIVKPETFQSPANYKSVHVEMDGVNLPWLQWETSNDTTPLSCNSKSYPSVTPKPTLWDAAQEVSNALDRSTYSTSSIGSWSPGLVSDPSMKLVGDAGTRFKVDIDDYLNLQSDETFLLERWRQQQRINSGGLLLCHHMF